MEPAAIKQMITDALSDATVIVEGDGRHFDVVVVSPDFSDKSRIQKQQLVYKALGDSITSGKLHAIALKTFTPEEWQQQHG